MSEKTACPVCREPVENGQAVCPRCGFKLEGQTEQFHRVSVGDTGDLAAGLPRHQGTIGFGTPSFTILKGPMAGETFKLTSFPMSIGRDPSCGLFLNDRTVTRRHASIDVVDNEVIISDLNSLNGMWVDGEMRDHATLVNGTIVQIGIFTMEFNM